MRRCIHEDENIDRIAVVASRRGNETEIVRQNSTSSGVCDLFALLESRHDLSIE